MPTLREIQTDFTEAIFSGDGADFSRNLVDRGLPPERLVDIYRNNVFGTLTDALKMAYPVVCKLVGAEFFAHLASSFIRQTPSRSGDLHNFGGEMAGFIADFQECLQLTYLPGVARLEWACHQVFFSADHHPLKHDRLAAVPADRYGDLKFRLHPATRLTASEYPVHVIWETNQEGFSGDPAVDLDIGGVHLLVSRKEYQAVLNPVTRAEWSFLSACRAGGDLSSASAAALAVDPQFDVPVALKQLVADSILVDFSL